MSAPRPPSPAADAIRALDLLPTLSPIAARLLEVATTDDAELSVLADLIESDPALSANVLSLCRRANLGVSSRITTVRHAVVMLGLDAVRAAVLSLCIHQAIESVADGAHMAAQRLGCWTRCLAVACAAESLASQVSPRIDPAEAFCAGLLHDLGLIALVAAIPRTYARVAEHALANHAAAAVAERRILGIDHHDAGRRLCERWSLPSYIAHAAQHHALPPHAVPESPHARLVMLVSLSEAITRRAHLGWSPDADDLPSPDAFAQKLALPHAALERCATELADMLADRCRALGIEPTPSNQTLLESLNQANQRIAILHKAMAKRNKDVTSVRNQLDSLTALIAQSASVYDVSDAARAVSDACTRCGITVHRVSLTRDGVPSQVFSAGSTAEPGSTGVSPDARSFAVPLSVEHELVIEFQGAGGAPLTLDLLRPAIAAIGAHALALEQNRSAYEQLARAGRDVVELQRALVERQSLARLGEMAAGAAHEMNTPLAVIHARAQLLGASINDPSVSSAASMIAQAAGELASIIEALSEIASPPLPEIARHEAIAVLQKASELSGVDFSLDNSFHTPNVAALVECDENLLARALGELLRNAREADPSHPPTVLIEVSGGVCSITVCDQGAGFSSGALAGGFNPFFSDKPAGRGRGMGLARARAFVEAMGGTISISNRTPSGARASMTLPASSPLSSKAA